MVTGFIFLLSPETPPLTHSGNMQNLAQDESLDGTLEEWINSLPMVSQAALGDLEKNISADDFRVVDDDMWK